MFCIPLSLQSCNFSFSFFSSFMSSFHDPVIIYVVFVIEICIQKWTPRRNTIRQKKEKRRKNRDRISSKPLLFTRPSRLYLPNEAYHSLNINNAVFQIFFFAPRWNFNFAYRGLVSYCGGENMQE